MNLQTLFFKRRIMSMLIKMKAIVLVICVLFSSSSVWAQNEKPFVIPELREWQGASGRYLPNTGARLICESNNPDLLRVVRAFSADYQEMFGVSLPVSFGKAGTRRPDDPADRRPGCGAVCDGVFAACQY